MLQTNMKKQTLIIIGILVVVLVVGLVVAGGTIIGGFKGGQKIDTQRVNILLEKTGANKINPEVSDIICNSKDCWSNIYQENVINTQWRHQISYCDAWIYTNFAGLDGDETSIKTNDCKEYIDYTFDELTSMRDDFVAERLDDYAQSLQEQQDEDTKTYSKGGAGNIEISGGGVIGGGIVKQ